MEKDDLKELAETTARSKSNTKRLDNVEKRVEDIHSLTISIEKIANEVKNMREELNKIDKRLLAIEEKPRKKLDLIWGYIVSAIIGCLIAFIFVKLGMK